jgi:hypothetical protein
MEKGPIDGHIFMWLSTLICLLNCTRIGNQNLKKKNLPFISSCCWSNSDITIKWIIQFCNSPNYLTNVCFNIHLVPVCHNFKLCLNRKQISFFWIILLLSLVFCCGFCRSSKVKSFLNIFLKTLYFYIQNFTLRDIVTVSCILFISLDIYIYIYIYIYITLLPGVM